MNMETRRLKETARNLETDNTRDRQVIAASRSFTLFADPAHKCGVSSGPTPFIGIAMPSFRSLRRWGTRVAAGAAIVKAILEDGAPVLTYVENLISSMLA